MPMYNVNLEPDDNGTLLVTCPDLSEVGTFGDDRDDALRHAADAIEEALAARIARREAIPAPSGAGEYVVDLPALTVAKVALYRAAREAGVSKAELGRRLQWHPPQVDRLFDLNHASRLDQLDLVFRMLGKTVVLSVEDAA